MFNICSPKQQIQSHLLKSNNIDFKRIKIFVMIFATCVLSFSVFSVAAGSWDDPHLTDFWNPLAYIVYLAFYLVFGGDMFTGKIFGYQIFGNGIMGNLIFDTTNSNMAAGIWGLIESVYSVIQPVGITLVVLYFLLSLMERVQMENFNIEHFLKSFIKLIIAIMLISNGLKLLEEGLEFSNALYYSIVKAVGPEEGAGMGGLLPKMYEGCKSMGILEALGTLVLCIPMVLCNLIAILAMYIISFSRLFQIGIYGVFAPIGMANIYEGGLNSSGFRYFKKFLAVGLQGIIIYVIVIIMDQLSAALIHGGGKWNAMLGVSIINIWNPAGMVSWGVLFGVALVVNLIICFTAVSLMFKAMSFANDVVGV